MFLTFHILFSCTFCRSTLSTELNIKDQYITKQYSALQNCIVQYSIHNCHVMFNAVPQCS